MSTREFDIVLLGPTGYTGQFTAENIYKTFPTTLKWAVAGRSASKMEKLLKEWRQLGVDRSEPGNKPPMYSGFLYTADNENFTERAIEILVVQMTPAELDSLAKRTRLIINCVGPYHLYSTPVVEACAKNGVHYVDVLALCLVSTSPRLFD